MAIDYREKKAASKAINNCVKKLAEEFKLKKPKATQPTKRFDSMIRKLKKKIRRLER